MSYQRKKGLGKKYLGKHNLANLKGWAHKRDVLNLQAFWRNAPVSNSWTKDETFLLKTMKLWSKTLGSTIDPSVFKGETTWKKSRR